MTNRTANYITKNEFASPEFLSSDFDFGRMVVGGSHSVVVANVASGATTFKSRIPAPNLRGALKGENSPSYMADYYFRIHSNPQKIDMQTIASAQVRKLSVWNAWPNKTANLTGILISDNVGVSVRGPAVPSAMKPLQEYTFEVVVGTSGPPALNTQIQFQFADGDNPPVIWIVGNRAVKLGVIPEVPVNETWEFLTDNIVAVDGTEQRTALRGQMPRVSTSLSIKFEKQEEIKKFVSDIATAKGRLWIPEWQFMTTTTKPSVSGSKFIYFDNARTDIRDGEYILLQTPTTSELLQVHTLTADGAELISELTHDLPVRSQIAPGSSAIISNNSSFSRYAVDNPGAAQLNCDFLRQRKTPVRQGSTVVLPLYKGKPIIEKRPLANEQIRDSIDTGQQVFDNKIGLQDVISRWEYSRFFGQRSFLIQRVFEPEAFDYWKALFAYSRGQCQVFYMPTYRTDLEIGGAIGDATNTYKIKGEEYADKFFSLPTHREIEIETSAGIQRATVKNASSSNGISEIVFDPAMPAGENWRDVKRISFVLPVRMGDDKIEFKHYGLETIVSFSIRTAENV